MARIEILKDKRKSRKEVPKEIDFKRKKRYQSLLDLFVQKQF